MVDPEEEEKISIRCPQCGQRFHVGPEFMGKMVECGSCNERFRVEGDAVIRSKKFYPGEHKDARLLEGFNRVPSRAAIAASSTVINPGFNRPDELKIFSPGRLMLGVVAVLGTVITGLTLGFAGAPGRLLDGTALGERFVLAGFVGVLAMVLLILANRQAKLKGALGGLACLVTLLLIPFFAQEGLPQPAQLEDDYLRQFPTQKTEAEVTENEEDGLADVRRDMRPQPLLDAIENYNKSSDKPEGKTVVGVWLRDVREYNRDLIMKYLIQKTGADHRSWSYPRPPADVLVVLYGVSPDLRQLSGYCERFGKPERLLEQYNAVEVRVDNRSFSVSSSDELNNPQASSFYELNLKELDSIDIGRATEAARRLAGAEPKLLRDDIAKKLQELAGGTDAGARKAAVAALQAWAQEGDGSVELVRRLVAEAAEGTEDVPRELVEFLAKRKDAGSISIVHQLWLKDPGMWTGLFGDFGPGIEDLLIADYPELSFQARLAAINLLGRVGTARGAQFLRDQRAGANTEMSGQIDKAVNSIERR